MDRFAKLVILLALAAAGGAHAGYAQLQPPVGWTPASGSFATYQPPANASQWLSSTARTNAALNVGGRAVQIPATMRLAANAPRIAAAFLFANPALRTAVGIASWLGIGGLVWDAAEQAWKYIKPAGDDDPGFNYEWRIYDFSGSIVLHDWTSSPSSACSAYAAYRNSQQPHNNLNFIRFELPSSCIFKEEPRPWNQWPQEQMVGMQRRDRQTPAEPKCPSGWTYTPAGCLSPAVTQPQFEQSLAPSTGPSTMPDKVPNELPNTIPWPVKDPVINPDTDGKPQPLFVPTGNPVKNPNYDPSKEVGPNNQPYLQPGVRVVPSPVPGSPWQVDVQPINRPVSSPDANPNPVNDSPTDSDKPREDTPDLCQLHPDILACQKLDEPPDTDLPSSEKPISITQDSGWGSMSATCPPPRHIMVQGRDIPIPFDLFCQYMEGMRPIIVAMAWLSAAFILLGAREGD